jgi:EAL domain-containing protein (putative c-di-GMP-specific phosphodiesterase class I)
VRLLSHRPSVLFKLEHLGDQAQDADVSVEGVLIAGPGWGERLQALMADLSNAERAQLFAVRLDDPAGLPLAAKTLLDRARTDWFPKFLSQGQLTAVFQPLVDLSDGSVYGREALIRGRMGKVEVRGQELADAAEVHDAIFSFDARARAAVLEAGLPRLPDGELLFVKLDPRAVLDVETSLRAVWPQVERAGGEEGENARIGLELIGVERHGDLDFLRDLVAAHRDKGAIISLDDVSVGTDALGVLEELRPEVAKLSQHLCKGIETSSARRHLVGGLVEVAHELGVRVVAVGIERDHELESIQELGVDLGQGFYLGQPNEEMLPVDRTFVTRSAKSPA